VTAPRIALVGVGSWGRHILRDLRTLGCEVVAVARSAASVARAEEGGATAVVDDVRGIDAVDGAVVATNTASHAEITLQLLDLGVPIFVEKPLTDDPARAWQVVERGGGRVFVMDKWRYHPGVLELARIAACHELGAVVGLRTTRLSWGNPHRPTDDIWILAPHDLALALEILGHIPQPRSARAYRMSSGAAGLVAHLGESPWMALDVGGASAERRRRVELLGEHGVAWLDGGDADHLGVARDDAVGTDDWERRPIPGELPLLSELRDFVAHVRGGPPPRSSAREGASIVECIATLRRMARLS
jgi:predicted dehydrogenase